MNSEFSEHFSVVHGGMNEGSICVPTEIKDIGIILLYPPLYVFLYELNSDKFQIVNIIICFILTCCFYFPGVIYAYSFLRKTSIDTK